jgi:hypothetical protein
MAGQIHLGGTLKDLMMTKETNEVAAREDDSAGVVAKTVQEQLIALQAGMDEHLNDLRLEVIAAEAAVQAKKALCALLPADLPLAPTGIRMQETVYLADASLAFEVVSREQVLQLLAALPGVDAVKVQGGTCAFVPDERFTPNNCKNAVVTPIGEVVYRVSSGLRGLKEEYSWWTRLGDKLVRIVASNEKCPQAKARPSSRTHSRFGSVEDRQETTTWDYTDLPKGQVTRWYGGNASNLVPLSVHVPRGSSMMEALSLTMSAQATVVSNKCSC